MELLLFCEVCHRCIWVFFVYFLVEFLCQGAACGYAYCKNPKTLTTKKPKKNYKSPKTFLKT